MYESSSKRKHANEGVFTKPDAWNARLPKTEIENLLGDLRNRFFPSGCYVTRTSLQGPLFLGWNNERYNERMYFNWSGVNPCFLGTERLAESLGRVMENL